MLARPQKTLAFLALCAIASAQSAAPDKAPRASGNTSANLAVYVISSTPPPRGISFSANPNPIMLAPGTTVGKTTLSWSAPGYTQLVIRVGGNNMTGTLGPSGSAETGNWVANGTTFTLVDLPSGQTIATLVVNTQGGPDPPPITFTANPNPIMLAPGTTVGKTTLSWSAPGYTQLVIRVGGNNMTGTLGPSGSAETGNWVANGTTFTLVDLPSGQTIATLVVNTQGGPDPPPITFTANPNPIMLAPGTTVGKTTLSWSAPGYTQLVIRVGGNNMTGTLGPSGSAETGNWVANGTTFTLIDVVSGRTLATLVVKTQGGTPPPATLTANPNPIVLAPGTSTGKTTLSWNAPGYNQVAIQVNGSNMTGTLGTSGSVETGTWVTNGTTFYLIDVPTGNILASVTVTTVAPPQQMLTMIDYKTVAELVRDASGNIDFCATPVSKAVFALTDTSVGVWFKFDGGKPGDTLKVQWIHPSGNVDSYQPGTTLDYSGGGCYAWFLGIRGNPPASEPGNWAVRVLVNGSTAFTLPFIVGSGIVVTGRATTADLAKDSRGNADYCATPVNKTSFSVNDASVWVWMTIGNGQPGDTLKVNWIHPSGRVNAAQPGATLDYYGNGCYAWFLGIRGNPPASEPGNWQVRMLINGVTAFTLPFSIR